MDQKHAVEDVLLDAGLPGLMLEATMFMEEFWKKYTRPGLLNGNFTFSLPGEAAQWWAGANGVMQLGARKSLGLPLIACCTETLGARLCLHKARQICLQTVIRWVVFLVARSGIHCGIQPGNSNSALSSFMQNGWTVVSKGGWLHAH